LTGEAMLTTLSELFAYRALIQALVVRDLKARYRGSLLGFFWTFLNPILLMATYTLVFSVYMRVEVEHYAVFLMTGLLPWLWFSSSLQMGAKSVLDGGELLKKVFFPPQVLPAVTVLTNFANFLLSLPLLFGFLLLFGVRVGGTLVALLPLMVIQLVLTYGLTLIVAAMTVRYRDVAQLLTNFLMVWFFVSPVLYPANLVPPEFAALLTVNPVAPLLMGYQSILLHNAYPLWRPVGVAVGAAVGAMMLGMLVFNRFRWTFAEEV
jgi:lipopolysaccharide transport system permease protein